ncbi:MAG: TVP38/TMEM64 family protein [Hyphomicrobiaceae bacterium]
MTAQTSSTGGWQRFLPLIVLAAVMVLVFAMGWHRYLSLKTIGLNYEALKSFISSNLLLSVLGFIAAYICVVALSLPGGLVMTLAGGLLFGWQIGAPAAVIGATIGATLLFLIARSSLGESLAARAGPSIAKLRQGFQDNAFSYLLFLRLVPAFPFVIVNLAPALLGVKFSTYVAATFLGIIPGTTAYSIAGAGLASVVEAQNKSYKDCLARLSPGGGQVCDYSIDTSQLATKELVIAFIALGLVALIPVAIKKWSKRNAAA